LGQLQKSSSKEQREHIDETIRAAHALVEGAHVAFELLYEEPRPKSKREKRHQRVARWLAGHGFAA